MEFPDDILRLVHEFAQPSNRYKVGKRILAILERDHPLGPLRKELRNAVRFHYETFLPLFLQLEKSYAEFTPDTPLMEYKRQHFICVEYDLMNLLYSVG